MTEIVVHIGAPKTGSTALQRFLFDNREALAAAGVAYPEVSLRGYGHHDLAFLVSGGYPDWSSTQDRDLDALTADLAAALAAQPARLLLSSENFYLFPAPERLAEVLRRAGAGAEDTVKILVYLRRQDDAQLSWYNQMIKAQGYSGSLAEALEAHHDLWDYAKGLTAWADTFGKDQLIVRRYQPRDLVGGDIVLDALAVLGLDPAGFPKPGLEVNTRLNRDVLEFQRLLNRLPLPPERLRRRHRELIELTRRTEGQGLFDDSPLLDAAGRFALRGRYAESNAAVAAAYFGEALLFDEPTPEADERPAKPEHSLGAEALATIVGWLLVQD